MKTCKTTGKVTYYNFKEAERYMKTAFDIMKKKNKQKLTKLHIYKCPDCGFWHLTKLKERF